MINEIGTSAYGIIIIILLGLGYAQGHITGSALKRKFKMGRKFSFLSIPIAGLFIIQAILKIQSMSNTEKLPHIQSFTNQDLSGLSNIIQPFLPHDSFGWISLGLPLVVLTLSYSAGIHGDSKKFVTSLSLIAFLVMMFVKVTGLKLDEELMTLFVVYQLSIPVGIFVSSGALKKTRRLSSRLSLPHF